MIILEKTPKFRFRKYLKITRETAVYKVSSKWQHYQIISIDLKVTTTLPLSNILSRIFYFFIRSKKNFFRIVRVAIFMQCNAMQCTIYFSSLLPSFSCYHTKHRSVHQNSRLNSNGEIFLLFLLSRRRSTFTVDTKKSFSFD